MRYVVLYCIVRVHATCSDCCRPDEACDTAYRRGEWGRCCGDGICCPTSAICTRCAYLPDTRCLCTRHADIGGDGTFFLLLIIGVCALSVCLWWSHYYNHPRTVVVPATNHEVSSPLSHATGFLGEVPPSKARHDHSPEPEPPSYTEATFDTDV